MLVLFLALIVAAAVALLVERRASKQLMAPCSNGGFALALSASLSAAAV
jgi:hypothetical protein